MRLSRTAAGLSSKKIPINLWISWSMSCQKEQSLGHSQKIWRIMPACVNIGPFVGNSSARTYWVLYQHLTFFIGGQPLTSAVNNIRRSGRVTLLINLDLWFFCKTAFLFQVSQAPFSTMNCMQASYGKWFLCRDSPLKSHTQTFSCDLVLVLHRLKMASQVHRLSDITIEVWDFIFLFFYPKIYLPALNTKKSMSK